MFIPTLKNGFGANQGANARLVHAFREFSSTAPASSAFIWHVNAVATALLFPSFSVIHLNNLAL